MLPSFVERRLALVVFHDQSVAGWDSAEKEMEARPCLSHVPGRQLVMRREGFAPFDSFSTNVLCSRNVPSTTKKPIRNR
jgi:hypothetical protein